MKGEKHPELGNVFPKEVSEPTHDGPLPVSAFVTDSLFLTFVDRLLPLR